MGCAQIFVIITGSQSNWSSENDKSIELNLIENILGTRPRGCKLTDVNALVRKAQRKTKMDFPTALRNMEKQNSLFPLQFRVIDILREVLIPSLIKL